MRLSNETKVFIGITIGTLLLVFAAIFFLSRPAKQAEALPKSSLILDTTHIKGEASASAYLVEFSDFQCPACKAIQPYVEQILSTYKDSLLFAYRHYPLPQHPYARKAAEAAEAAGAQGKFFEMAERLFAIDNQENLSDDFVLSAAKSIDGLDLATFQSDWKSGKFASRVATDETAGNALGINATPTFFLNGRKLEFTNYKAFSDLIAAEIAASSQQK
jgi:protein-disulfide isomerase